MKSTNAICGEEIMQIYIFLDVDGTLLHSEGGKEFIPPSACQAVALARRNGHKVFICTGRPVSELTELVKSVEVDGYVCSTGAYIFVGDTIVYQFEFSQAALEELRQVAEKNDFGLVLQGMQKPYIDARGESFFAADGNEKYMAAAGVGRMRLSQFRPIREYERKSEKINKLLFLTRDDHALEKVEEMLRGRYRMAVHGLRGEGVLISEVSDYNVIKSTGVRRVVDFFGGGDVMTYGYGDSSNDVDMLAFCSHGVAMGNASDEAKRAADEVCEPLLEDGLYKSFQRNGLI